MTTVRVQRERAFGAAPDDAFRLVTDIEAWPLFWPGLVRVEPGSRWSAPGDEARLVMRFLRREVLLEMTLHDLVVPRYVAYDSVQAGLPDARHERHFQPAGGGTLYRILVEYEPRRGLGGLLDRTIVRAGANRVARRTLENLEPLLDASKDHPRG
jgi:hypothetical protein